MLTTLILNTRYNFITDYADFRDYMQHIKSNFSSDYANYADFQNQIRNNFITDDADCAGFRGSKSCKTPLKLLRKKFF